MKEIETETVSTPQVSSAARILNTLLVTFYTRSLYCQRIHCAHTLTHAHVGVQDTHGNRHTPTRVQRQLLTHTLCPAAVQAGRRLDQINMKLVMQPQRRG